MVQHHKNHQQDGLTNNCKAHETERPLHGNIDSHSQYSTNTNSTNNNLKETYYISNCNKNYIFTTAT